MIPLALGAAVSPLAFAGAIALMTGPSPLVTTFALYVPALKLIEESGVGAYLLVTVSPGSYDQSRPRARCNWLHVSLPS